VRRPPGSAAVAAIVVAACAAATARAGDAAAPSSSAPSAARCAGHRYKVRNLLDPAAADVSLRPRRATVRGLRGLEAPRRVTGSTPRLRPVEYRTYRVRAPLVAGRRLPTGDIVLVVGRPPATMHVVFPDTHVCEDIVSGIMGQEIHVASDEVENLCGVMPTKRWRRLGGRAEIVGVGFLAAPGAPGLVGAAPNRLEIHPAVSFAATSRCRGVAGTFPA
jgi:hypothetical protein